MSFQYGVCPACGPYEHYQKLHIVPPCPRCGYPEMKKTPEEYYRSMGVGAVDVKKQQPLCAPSEVQSL